uniref:VWFC domain-containing protein n=1 Tax=Plectus sambesii TaxID=2011161 RepID=A0A914VAX1_9BILA
MAQQFQNCSFEACPAEQTCTRISFQDELCSPLGTAVCSKAVEVAFRCNTPSCCPPYKVEDGKCVRSGEAMQEGSLRGSWSEWSEWSACVGPKCGGCAMQVSRRNCNDAGCDGLDTRFRRCRLDPCQNCLDGEPDYTLFTQNGTCDGSALCDVIKQQLARIYFKCPCCSDLSVRNGQCLPFVS